MKAYLFTIVVFLFGFTLPVHASEQWTPVELYSHGKKFELSELDQSKLQEQALQLLKTSNHHSGQGARNNIFTLHGVQDDYRATVAGKFLVCRFQPSKKVTTIGGDILVSEIVIGLNHAQYASSLFTVDEDGSVVGHAKYSGGLCAKILQAINKLQE